LPVSASPTWLLKFYGVRNQPFDELAVQIELQRAGGGVQEVVRLVEDEVVVVVQQRGCAVGRLAHLRVCQHEGVIGDNNPRSARPFPRLVVEAGIVVGAQARSTRARHGDLLPQPAREPLRHALAP
jgi:hypothetical protein